MFRVNAHGQNMFYNINYNNLPKAVVNHKIWKIERFEKI